MCIFSKCLMCYNMLLVLIYRDDNCIYKVLKWWFYLVSLYIVFFIILIGNNIGDVN